MKQEEALEFYMSLAAALLRMQGGKASVPYAEMNKRGSIARKFDDIGVELVLMDEDKPQ